MTAPSAATAAPARRSAPSACSRLASSRATSPGRRPWASSSRRARAADTTFRYRAELAEGTVAFADSSRAAPRTFVRLAAITRRISRDVCGLPR